MKLLQPAVLLFLCGNVASFAPNDAGRKIVPALFARGKSKLAKAKKAEYAASAASAVATPKVALIDPPAYVDDVVSDVVKQPSDKHEAARRGLLKARLEMEAKARATATPVVVEASKPAFVNADAVKLSNAKHEAARRGLLQARLEMEAKARSAAVAAGALAAAEAEAIKVAEAAAAVEAEAVRAAEAAAAEAEATRALEAAAAAEAEAIRVAEAAAAEAEAIRVAEAAAEAEAIRVAEAAAAEAALKSKEIDYEARRAQPKSPEEEAILQAKYGALELGERCFQILVDLGYVIPSPEPGDADFDGDDIVY